MIGGILLLACHVLMTLTGTGTYLASEKGRAQAFNEISIFVVGLLCSSAAAALLRLLGWQMLNLALLPWLAAAFLAILTLGFAGSASARIKA